MRLNFAYAMADQPVRGDRTSAERIISVEIELRELTKRIADRERTLDERLTREHHENRRDTTEIKSDVKEVLVQVNKTNGRVTQHDMLIAKLKGGWAVVAIVCGAVGALGGFAVRDFITKLFH